MPLSDCSERNCLAYGPRTIGRPVNNSNIFIDLENVWKRKTTDRHKWSDKTSNKQRRKACNWMAVAYSHCAENKCINDFSSSLLRHWHDRNPSKFSWADESKNSNNQLSRHSEYCRIWKYYRICAIYRARVTHRIHERNVRQRLLIGCYITMIVRSLTLLSNKHNLNRH